MSAEQEALRVGDRIRLSEAAGVPDGVFREACADRLLRVQRTEGDDPGYILVSGTRYGDQWLPASDFELVERRQPTPAELIQQARDVLATWGEGNVNPWSFDPEGVITDDLGYVRAKAGADARLIVGTAGNPELLDAIDAALDMANSLDGTAYGVAEQFAAAIIAADGRMRA